MNRLHARELRNTTAAFSPRRIFRLSLLVAVSLAGGFALARLWPESSRVLPVPAVCSYLYVSPREPLIGGDGSDASGKKDAAFLATQRVLVTSPDVLAEAVRSPEIANLSIIKSQAEPEVWLRDHVRVELLENTRLLRVSVSGPEPAQQAAIVNEITKVYLQKAKTWADDDSMERLQPLAMAERELAKTLEDLRERMRDATSPGKAPIDLEDLRDRIALDQELLKTVRMAKMGLEWEAGQGARVKLIARARVSPTR